MLRATFVAVLGSALLAAPGVAVAVPAVTFKAEAVPIKGFPHTGNIYGAGAAVKAEYTITGGEYFGSPPPVIGVNFYLPEHAVLHTSGFPTCSEAVLRESGPIGCPKASRAGPTGSVLGYVTFGSERVEELTELFSFYNPAGGLTFFDFGHSPTVLEIYSNGGYVNLHGAAGFGPELKTIVPLVESVPGAPYASIKTITVQAGSAIKTGKGKHAKTIYYGRVPKKGQCPKGGFNVKTEVIFAENGEVSKPVTVTKSYKAPCPRK
jgi:hypothetical protein